MTAIGSLVGTAFTAGYVWGVLNTGLRDLRDEVKRARDRLDAFVDKRNGS